MGDRASAGYGPGLSARPISVGVRMKVGDRSSGVRRWDRAMILLYVATAALIPLQRGVWGTQPNVFKIFRQSFWHLVEGRNLYAAYPLEQGAGAADLFKYS